MNKQEIQTAADAIYEAEIAGEQIAALTAQHPDMSMEDAYAVQSIYNERKLGEGRKLIGHKIGLTSKAMQTTMNIDTPDYGIIMDDMLFADGSEIETAKLCDLRVEAELAFVMKDHLQGADVTMLDVLSATDYVIPAVELIVARIHRKDPETGYNRTVKDTISDNASCGGVIMGGRPIKPMEMDLRWLGGLMYRNGVLEETGLAAGVMNHPANGVAWLTKTYAEQGRGLEPGQIVLAGSFTRPLSAKAGDTFHIDYGVLGGISFSFK